MLVYSLNLRLCSEPYETSLSTLFTAGVSRQPRRDSCSSFTVSLGKVTTSRTVLNMKTTCFYSGSLQPSYDFCCDIDIQRGIARCHVQTFKENETFLFCSKAQRHPASFYHPALNWTRIGWVICGWCYSCFSVFTLLCSHHVTQPFLLLLL